MGYRLRAAVAAQSIAFLAACPETTGPTEKLEVDLEFGIDRPQTEPAFVVEAGTGEIIVRGNFEAACRPYSASVRADVTDGDLGLHVYAHQPTDGCRQVLDTAGYQAIIRDVPAGTYSLFVFHEYPSGATTLYLMESQVVVP